MLVLVLVLEAGGNEWSAPRRGRTRTRTRTMDEDDG